MLNTCIAPKREKNVVPEEVEEEKDGPERPDHIYLPILATLEEKCADGLEESIIKDLREQFDPVQVPSS